MGDKLRESTGLRQGILKVLSPCHPIAAYLVQVLAMHIVCYLKGAYLCVFHETMPINSEATIKSTSDKCKEGMITSLSSCNIHKL